MSFLDYVREQISRRIDAVAQESLKSDLSEDGVHDLRVAIRRLSESLRVFEDLFPQGSAKAVRKDLKAGMRLAGEVRNHDIAIDLLRKARLAGVLAMRQARSEAASRLGDCLKAWNENVSARAWLEQLHV